MSNSATDVSLFGWDLTLNSVKNDIKTKEDMLAVITHWCLIKAGFRCVGVGESMEECESDSPSEILPEGWNFTDNHALRYTYNNKLYNLAINKSGTDIVFINIIHKGQNFALDVKLDDVIKNLSGPMSQIVPNYKEFLGRFQTNLIKPMVQGKSAASCSADKTDVRSEKSCDTVYNQQVPPRRPVPPPEMYPTPLYPANEGWRDPLADPRQVGRADLDPFHQGGGMLFAPPPDRPGLPRGAVPPGARFDPFRPDGLNPDPTPGPRRPPGTDHFPPPGYDDMFM